MIVVTVEFLVAPERAADFRAAVVDNARASREREPGCRQFDVCADANESSSVFLYEVYDDAAAFDEHLASGHFRAFDALVAPWLRGKTVRRLQRLDPS